MELFSPRFRRLVEIYLDTHNPFISTMTMVYNDKFVDEIKRRDDVILIEINRKNWDEKYREVMEIVEKIK